ncbi:hypothetical protein WFQ12_04300 [Yersinia enterocolitica]|uniref:hypothetical protein n=1 Tax=Enterobacterales TaxID=91347 RepID=UPI000319BFB4|nr:MULTISPECIES: hypothetical protein [Enterobacterales]MCV3311881.1 hypothetical protein [Yersinia enterocolitica]UYJ89821.1 hypothetical protein N4228_02505 [Yersinia enterocolitica]UYJ93853.1 hypothetical protein N4225_02505 [Yersinia enterocolitica]UYK23313.1 hypothetical protein N4223_02500 [Yersinia enterocolitica]UYK27292.1 hypothetical protein N4222_02500 [Yersinia enterocolitica]
MFTLENKNNSAVETGSFLSITDLCEREDISITEIISDWLSFSRKLFVKLDAVPCCLQRPLEGDGDSEIENITSGSDEYQSVFGSTAYRVFIPLNPQECEIEKNKNPNEIVSSYISYQGLAYGFWEVKPTKITRFANEGYHVANGTSRNAIINNPGAVVINGNVSDHILFFNHSFVIFKEDFFVGPDIEAVLDESLLTKDADEVSPQNIKSVVAGAESNADQNANAKEIVKEAKERVSKAERDAIFIMLSKNYKSKNGKLEAAPIANMLNSDAKDILPGREFSPETIRRWLKSVQ